MKLSKIIDVAVCITMPTAAMAQAELSREPGAWNCW